MTMKIGDTLDLLKIAVLNFAPEVAVTAPASPIVGQMWTDTSTLGAGMDENAITRYWDGHRWARMDGGGDIPDGMIENRHIAADALIDWSKINAPDLGTAEDVTNINAALSALSGRVDGIDSRLTTAEADIVTLKNKDISLTSDVAGLRTDMGTAQGDISDLEDLTADQATAIQGLTDTVGDHTDSIVDLEDDVTTLQAELDAAELAATTLTGRVTAVEGVNTTQDGRLAALETATSDINVATQEELDDLDARVTVNETNITSLQTDLDAAESGLAAEISRSTTEDAAIRTAFAAADDGLQANIDAEATTRLAGDTANASAIDAEETRATAAEDALDTRVADLEAIDTITQAEFDTEQTRVNGALALKADLVDGLVPKSQLPSIAIATVTPVADAAARDLLTADEGDIAILLDGGGTFIYDGESSSWLPLSSGADAATDAEVAGAVASEAALRQAADADLQGQIDDLAAIDNATQAELDAEVLALETADATNAGAISDEIDRATAAELALNNDIDAEVTRATAEEADIRADFATADTALQGAIDAETARATAAEGTLTTNLATETTTRGTADAALGVRIDDVEADLAAEITRSTDADTTMDAAYKAADAILTADVATRAVDDEVVHLDGGETITGVKSFATGATPKVFDDPSQSTEVANKRYVDSKAQGAVYDDTALAARVSTAETDIDALESGLAAETGARTSADSAMASRLDTLQGDAATVGSVANSVATEATARSTADSALQLSISQEATNRADADTTLQTNIGSEATARMAADTQLRTDFETADTAIRGEFATADTAVRNAFAAADDLLQADIDARAMDTAVVHNTGDEAVGGVKTFSDSPIVPDGAAPGEAVNLGQLDTAVADAIAGAASDTGDLDDRVTAIEGADAGDSMREVANDAISLLAGANGGLATLDGGGKIPALQLPALALTNVQVVADIDALDALTGQDEGDVAIVVDSDGDGTRQTFVYDGTDWIEMSSPADVTEEELAAAVDAALTPLETRIDGLGAGAGLTRSGDTFDVVGTADRIAVTADAVDIASTYAGQASITTLGVVGTGTWNGTRVDIAHGGTGMASGTTLAELKTYLGISSIVRPYTELLTTLVPGTPQIVNHNLGTEDITYSVRIESTGEFIIAGVVALNDNSVSVTVDDSFAGGVLKIVIHG